MNIMKANQSFADMTSTALQGLDQILAQDKPDCVLVQGDTTTTLAASLAAFYHKIPVGHIEAGLRSFDRYAPWPEEINRKLTSCIASMHFVPTQIAKNNLLKENIANKNIFVTGNTVIDALLEAQNILNNDKELLEKLAKQFSYLDGSKKLILVTGHRRESFGEGFKQICSAMVEIAQRDDVQIIYPVHLNPRVQEAVNKYLAGENNIFLITPQDYLTLIYLMQRSYLILTDSGGIQEEAPTLGKPVIVMRDTTERPEGVIAGTSKLVGAKAATIVAETIRLIDDVAAYKEMALVHNPYGDGNAARYIVEGILRGCPHPPFGHLLPQAGEGQQDG